MTSCSTFNSLSLLILQHLWWLYCCIIAKHSYILSVDTYKRTQIETHFKMYSFILISVWFTHEYAHKWGSSVPERSYMKEGRAEHRDEKGQSSLDPWKVLGEAGSSGLSFKMAVLLCTGLLYSTLRENTPNIHRLLLSFSPSLSQGGHPITSPSSSPAELCQWDRQGETRKGQKVFTSDFKTRTYLRRWVAHLCSTGNKGSRHRCSEAVQPPRKGMLHCITEPWHGETTFKIKETKMYYFSPWYDRVLRGGIF